MAQPRYGFRRQAAINAHTAITGTAPAPRPLLPPPPAVVHPPCMVCTLPVDPVADEFETCMSCRRWAHHDCINPLLVPYDRQCRGLCGYVPPNPLGITNTACPNCTRPFRANTLARRQRWIRIFGTNAWQSYIDKLQPHNHPARMQPSILRSGDPNNCRFDSIYMPNTEHFLKNPPDFSNPPNADDPEYQVTDPNLLRWQGRWNQPGRPVRLHQQSWQWYANYRMNTAWAGADRASPEERWRYLIVHPSDHALPDRRDPAQRYMFSELNYLIHSKRKPWKKFCKWFDNYNLNFTGM